MCQLVFPFLFFGVSLFSILAYVAFICTVGHFVARTVRPRRSGQQCNVTFVYLLLYLLSLPLFATVSLPLLFSVAVSFLSFPSLRLNSIKDALQILAWCAFSDFRMLYPTDHLQGSKYKAVPSSILWPEQCRFVVCYWRVSQYILLRFFWLNIQF